MYFCCPFIHFILFLGFENSWHWLGKQWTSFLWQLWCCGSNFNMSTDWRPLDSFQGYSSANSCISVVWHIYLHCCCSVLWATSWLLKSCKKKLKKDPILIELWSDVFSILKSFQFIFFNCFSNSCVKLIKYINCN